MENKGKTEAPGAAQAGTNARRKRKYSEAAKSYKRELAKKGSDILRKYKNGKGSLERRIVSDELFWRQRYNDYAAYNKSIGLSDDGKAKDSSDVPRPTSAWLFNTIINKHADIMDSYPSAVCLPRERSDEETAKILTSVIPVILERCDFEKTYSDNAYYKIKHGTCAYGVFWDSTLENGLGDITVKQVDLLNLFWEPGISDIQQSKNVFCVTLCDKDDIKSSYPESGFDGGEVFIDLAKYVLDDNVDTSDKVLVVDWYYKKRIGERTVVHFIKFAGDTVLYSSESDGAYAQRGFYDHGKYPFVLDVMYPESGTPYGFGVISVTKDAQIYIDRLDHNILENSLMQSKVRYFIKKNASINKEQFLDFNEPLIEVEGGTLGDDNVRPIIVPSLDAIVVNVRDAKINEMKETSGNRDVNSGGTSGGVTSGAAIATLQEAGNKVSRDVISTSYRAFVDIVRLIIELMRQFYTESRTFRITEPNSAENTYVDFSSAQIAEQERNVGGEVMYRMPIFDIDVRAEKRSPFARLSQNETVMNLYSMGFFNPDNAQAASVAMEALEFEGKDAILERIKEGAMLLNTCKELQAQLAALSTQLGAVKSDMPSEQTSGGTVLPENMPAGSAADRNAVAAQGYISDRVREGVQV